jgi:hypothetical protein
VSIEAGDAPAWQGATTENLAHLRTALSLHTAEPLDRFVTLDMSQAHAARELGLPV